MSARPAGPGHNNGPTMEAGFAFRKFSWRKARKDLLPTLPIEVLKTRVRRAAELGLPYKTYASVRASTGRDVVGFLFSNNALRVIAKHDMIPRERAEKLRQLNDTHLAALVHMPLSAADLARIAQDAQINLDTSQAPHFTARWSEIRTLARKPIRAAGLPLDGVLVVGDQTLERDWSEAGKLAGYLPADLYFAPL